MGKGDKKSKRGKIWTGSYGNSRRKKAIKKRLKGVSQKKGTANAETGEGGVKAKRTPRKKAEA